MNWDSLLERTQWDLFWLPPTAHLVQKKEILYTYSKEKVGFLNAVYRLQASNQVIPSLIEEVMTFQNPISRWQITQSFQNDFLEQQLSLKGYQIGANFHGFVLPLENDTIQSNPRYSVSVVETLEDYNIHEKVIAQAFGLPETNQLSAETKRFDLKLCTGNDRRVFRLIVLDSKNQEAVCSGGINLFPSLQMGFLWAGGTIPEARGCGAYTALVKARLQIAKQAGCKAVGIYANDETSGPILRKLGFSQLSPMAQWSLSHSFS